MKQFFSILFLSFFLVISAHAETSDYGRSRIKTMSWEGIDVVWLQDERLPTYSIQIGFADGALGDGENTGIADATFYLLSSGTSRFNQVELSEYFEYNAISHGSSVSHEATSYSVSGLTKDIVPAMTRICHLFKDATFRLEEVENYRIQSQNGLQSMVNSHDSLASRAFREISMRGTPFGNPSGGKLADVGNITQENLKQTLAHFNDKVKKRIYLYGPQEVLSIKDIVLNKCGWSSQANFVRKVQYEKTFPSSGPQIYLVTVPQANQAKVYIGRYLNKSEFQGDDREIHSLMGRILAGGFTSLLMKELRVNRGWVYGVSAFSAAQRDYGRAVIETATKNEQVVPLLKETRKTVQLLMDGNISLQEFETFKNSYAKKYPFRFEDEESYLGQLAYFDHLEKDYSELYLLPQRVRKYSLEDVSQLTRKIFAWEKQTIMVLGSAQLKEDLEELGPVEVVDYKEFL